MAHRVSLTWSSQLDHRAWRGRLCLVRRRHSAHGLLTFLTLFTLLAPLATVALGACAPDARSSAQAAQAKLDRELQHARATGGVPDGLLQPIETREHALATASSTAAAGSGSGSGGSDQAYQAAAAGYARLFDQVVALERMPPTQARAQAQQDLQQLATALAAVQQQGFVEAAPYQQARAQAQQQLAAAATPQTTTQAYFAVDRFIEAQIAAVQLIQPVYQQLQAFTARVGAQNQALGSVAPSSQPQPLQCARGDNDAYFWPDPSVTVTPPQPPSMPTYEFQQWPAQDIAQFRAARSAQQYQSLATLISAQTQQLAAEVVLVAAPQAHSLVQAFQADIQTYQQSGGTDPSFQRQAAQDAQTLATATTIAEVSALLQTVQQQRTAFALPLLKQQTQHDMQTLQRLVNTAQHLKTIDPANGVPYPDGYEYADGATGIGDAQARLANAQKPDDFRVVDAEIQMLSTNLQAMLQNLKDRTAVDQPHQTDLSLLQHYELTNTRVIVVSLREQEARMYDGGHIVKAIKVTTGNPDLPSPPGVHCVLAKMQNYDDVSPFPKGSPWYYNPTHINFGMVYSDYGYIVHDAWWRSWFGKYSNLPHYDPISFNNGSHGCINLPLSEMPWLYQWSQVGTPVLVY